MNKQSPTTLGAYLRSAREEAGFSLRQLAKLIGADYSYLARIEAGERVKPGGDILQRIADVLEVDAAELLTFIGVKPNLPKPQFYFRRTYGLSQAEAEEAAQLIAERYNKQPKHSKES